MQKAFVISFVNAIFWKSGFLKAKQGKKRETSLPENVIFGDAMIFVTKCSVSHGHVILYIIYVLYIIYNIT